MPTLLPTLEPTPVPTLGPLPRTVLTSDGEAYQINAAHTGATQSTTLQPPFAQRWAIDLGGSVSYPIIVQGRVYVTIANPAGYGTKLVALNATSGQVAWGPVDLGGTYWWSALAYDQGSLFALTYDGVLRAFDAVTGVQRWSTQLPGQSSFTSAPTAVQGTVYVGGAGFGGTVYAVNATDGSLRWTAPVVNGDESSPVVVGDALFVSYACPNVFRFERLTGTPQWVWTTGCSGGGGKSAVYYDQRLYARDNGAGYVFDSQTGQLVARFQASAAPALADGRGFFRSGTVLTAVDLASMAPLWTYTGDGTLTTAPLVLNQSVIMGSAAGNLTVLEASTGQVLWSANVGTPIPAPDEQNVSQPLTGLSIGDGLLVVPAGTRLVAYAASGTPDTP